MSQELDRWNTIAGDAESEQIQNHEELKIWILKGLQESYQKSVGGQGKSE